MKIAHLSVGDPFTARWVNDQSALGHDVHLIMLEIGTEHFSNVALHILPFKKPFGYFLNIFHLRRLLKTIQPDIFHVHYATGNGLLGRLANYKPSILSVWGSDVMVSPDNSFLMRRLVKKNLEHYSNIISTSMIMVDYVKSIGRNVNNISVIPIGVDTEVFASKKGAVSPNIVIGTVKTLETIYGIDVLIKSFAIVKNRIKQSDNTSADKLKLIIVGGGSQLSELTDLATKCGVLDSVQFVGQIPNRDVPNMLRSFNIFVAMSRNESFGVAIVEASACELPVVTSNVGGLPEVVINNETGYLINTEDYEGCAEAIIKLVMNPQLRQKMGKNGRIFVQRKYEWRDCMNSMLSLYGEAIASQ
jgi:L-malate glycosyltransferase